MKTCTYHRPIIGTSLVEVKIENQDNWPICLPVQREYYKLTVNSWVQR